MKQRIYIFSVLGTSLKIDGSEDAHNCVAFFPPAHSHVINSKELLTKQLKIHESEYKAEKGYKKIKKYKKKYSVH